MEASYQGHCPQLRQVFLDNLCFASEKPNLMMQVTMNAEALRDDTDQLGAGITLARLQLIDLPKSPLTPKKIHTDAQELTSESVRRKAFSGFARIATKFTFKLNKNKKYSEMEEETTREPLFQVNASKKNSNSSEDTLVNDVNGDGALSEQENATFFLSTLAPLVAKLQRLGPLTLLPNHTELRMAFMDRCDEMSDLLKELKKEHLCTQADDDHEQEMGWLLVTALHKKVLAEKSRALGLGAHAGPLTMASGIEETKDPFIVQSALLSSLALSSHGSRDSVTLVSRTPSPPKRIVPAVPLEKGEYWGFVGQSQSTWRMHVHRLGSFQASALFSPSPVAVRRGSGRPMG